MNDVHLPLTCRYYWQEESFIFLFSFRFATTSKLSQEWLASLFRSHYFYWSFFVTFLFFRHLRLYERRFDCIKPVGNWNRRATHFLFIQFSSVREGCCSGLNNLVWLILQTLFSKSMLSRPLCYSVRDYTGWNQFDLAGRFSRRFFLLTG